MLGGDGSRGGSFSGGLKYNHAHSYGYGVGKAI
jgi:hypothetical protein